MVTSQLCFVVHVGHPIGSRGLFKSHRGGLASGVPCCSGTSKGGVYRGTGKDGDKCKEVAKGAPTALWSRFAVPVVQCPQVLKSFLL